MNVVRLIEQQVLINFVRNGTT